MKASMLMETVRRARHWCGVSAWSHRRYSLGADMSKRLAIEQDVVTA